MRRLASIGLASLLLACGGPEPRHGEGTLSEAAPRLTLTGRTFGQAAALELAPGCPGYLDAEQPGHVIHVGVDQPFTIAARSDDGPIALAVASDDEVRCDSDEGSGHAPSLRFERAGDYQVFVAALRAPAELAYELSVHTEGAGPAGGAPASGRARDVSVTITSVPTGAEVRGPDGSVVGVTPAMFMLSVPADQIGQERAWTLSLADHHPVTVTGALAHGAMVLHGQLVPVGPTHIEVTSAESQPIRDYQSASLAVEVAEQCAITDAEVEVDIRHSFVGDLRVLLRSPWGNEVILHRHEGGGRRNLSRSWGLRDRQGVLSALVGHSTRGRWTLVVHDDAGADQGTLERFDLRLTCGPPGVEDTTAATDAPDPRRPRHPASPTPPRRSPSLPDLPTRGEIVRVLGGLRSRAESCATQGGQARIMATVNGSTGRVTSVSSTGTATASERACVERVVRSARFGRFRRSSVDVDYSYDLPRRAAAAGTVISPWVQRR